MQTCVLLFWRSRRRSPGGSMKLFVLAAALLLGSSCGFSSPCLPGTLQDYIDLGSTGCTVGPATFANFFLGELQTIATEIPPSQVQVTPAGTEFTASLLFTVNQNAATLELFESSFHLDVTAANLTDALLTLGNST